MNEHEPAYTVHRVSDTTEFDMENGAYAAKRIDFKLPNGHESYIVVPASDFHPDHVKEQVHQAAKRILDTLAIQGPPIRDMG